MEMDTSDVGLDILIGFSLFFFLSSCILEKEKRRKGNGMDGWVLGLFLFKAT
jgi:hypothetical protein